MDLFARLLVEAGSVIGTVLLIEFLVLAFRNPHRPHWLHRESVQTGAALVIVASLCFSFAAFMTGLLEAGLNVFAALAAALLLPLVVAVVSGRAIRFRERLQRADAGQSPFDDFDGKRAALPAAQLGGRS